MTAPTLMFGIGATKAGTSWLYRYLAAHPDCHMRAIKEVHYFDALEFGNFDTWITGARRRARQADAAAATKTGAARARAEQVRDDALAQAALLDRRVRDDAAYLAYLDAGRSDQRLIGDITPAYALLRQRWLREMARLRPTVRFVYLLRDPVDRLWSHCRMIAARRASDPAEVPARAANILARVQAGKEDEIARRSDYRRPLKRLAAALDPAQWRVFFFEDLFTDDTVAAVCAFLGIRPVRAEVTRRVMAGPAVALAPDQRAAARDWLTPQYDFVAETLGPLPAAWHTQTSEMRS